MAGAVVWPIRYREQFAADASFTDSAMRAFVVRKHLNTVTRCVYYVSNLELSQSKSVNGYAKSDFPGFKSA